jgi:hypothetical protein
VTKVLNREGVDPGIAPWIWETLQDNDGSLADIEEVLRSAAPASCPIDKLLKALQNLDDVSDGDDCPCTPDPSLQECASPEAPVEVQAKAASDAVTVCPRDASDTLLQFEDLVEYTPVVSTALKSVLDDLPGADIAALAALDDTSLLELLAVMETQVEPEPPCRHFLAGGCYRRDCRFTHDVSRMACRFLAAGLCLQGSECPFMHEQDTRPLIATLQWLRAEASSQACEQALPVEFATPAPCELPAGPTYAHVIMGAGPAVAEARPAPSIRSEQPSGIALLRMTAEMPMQWVDAGSAVRQLLAALTSAGWGAVQASTHCCDTRGSF